MLPSRGLPPRQLASLASRQSSVLRSGTSRKFSSVPRKTAFSAVSSRTSALGSSNWRAGAVSQPYVVLSSASAVRHGSWYAPWTWGRSNTPAPSELTPERTPVPEPVAEPVTTATPELQPAGVDQAAATEAPWGQASIEELLATEPTKSVDSSFIDPTMPISYWGNLKDLGLDYGWGPSALFESLVEMVYINGQMGWAGTIIGSALILRTVMFFTFQRWGSDAMAKTAAMKPVLQPLQDAMEEAKRQGDEEKVQMYRLKQQHIMKDMGGNVGASIGTAIAQGVFGFGAFRSLRGMANLPAPGITTDGWAWFTDLSTHDPYYILPAATGFLMWQVFKRGGETGVQDQTAQTGFQKQAQVIFPGILFLVTMWQPAAIQLYFACTSMTGAVTGTLLRQNGVRRFLRIRPLPDPKSNELYSKVIKGELALSSIKGADGKVRYQAPRPAAPATQTQTQTKLASGIKVKSRAAIPAHMAGSAEKKEVKEEKPKSAWEQAKAIPKGAAEKIKQWQDPRDPEVKRRQDAKERQKAALRRYEEERKKGLR